MQRFLRPEYRFRLLRFLSLVGLCSLAGSVSAYQIQPDFVMFQDPEFDVPPVINRLDEKLLPLWQEAMARPEVDYQRQAAEAIAHAADLGYPGMEAAEADLVALLTTATHPAARSAAARALIAINAESSADELFEASQQYDSQLRILVEPALAAWKYAPILDTWRNRVRDANTNRSELLLALDGIAHLQDAEMLAEILEIVLSGDRPYNVRLAAARTAGAVADNGLEDDVDLLLGLENPQVVHRLCAVALLSRHDSETARTQLLRLARDVEPTIAEQSLGRLNEIDSELVIPLAEEARQNLDPKVRRRAADAYVALATPERVGFLSQMLSDVHPDVRTSIREDLYRLASQPELSAAVRESAFDVLQGDNWRGQEQAALILGALDYEPAAGRLIELLSSDRSEVEIATGWSLRKLAVPETLPDMFEHAQRRTTDRREQRATTGLDRQVAHLFESFALMDYRPAEQLMREYVPKSKIMGFYSRGAAVWALGHFHSNESDEALATQLMERLNDMNPFDPEIEIVWCMSAISLGRMHAEAHVGPMRVRIEAAFEHDLVAYAIRWAILQITGEVIPTPPPIVRGKSGWFLEPLIVDPPTEAAP